MFLHAAVKQNRGVNIKIQDPPTLPPRFDISKTVRMVFKTYRIFSNTLHPQIRNASQFLRQKKSKNVQVLNIN
jgi:hypothetical protein